MDRVRFVSVIGGEECSHEEAQLAEEVGRVLAQRGVTVICGGRRGVMEAVCRGAAAQGGTTVGILPGNSRREANPYVKIPVVTGIGYARNVIVAKSGQAVIAVGGHYGTLSEIAYALEDGIPVIGLGTWSLSQGDNEDSSIVVASSVAEAVEKALALARD